MLPRKKCILLNIIVYDHLLLMSYIKNIDYYQLFSHHLMYRNITTL